MIYYLIQSFGAHPDLAKGIPPAGLLNGAEKRQFEALRSGKRQREWLLGRWTAKHLLQMVVEARCGELLPLDSFTIFNTPSGAPHVTCTYLNGANLSISHRDDAAFCAVCLDGQSCSEITWGTLGVDIERVETRTGSFADDYFTGPEIERVRTAPESIQDLIITAIWSAKESALKAVNLGLSVDTRSVTCLLDVPRSIQENWAKFDLTYDSKRLNKSVPPLKGWWKTMGDYVLTCVGKSEPISMTRISSLSRLEAVA